MTSLHLMQRSSLATIILSPLATVIWSSLVTIILSLSPTSILLLSWTTPNNIDSYNLHLLTRLDNTIYTVNQLRACSEITCFLFVAHRLYG